MLVLWHWSGCLDILTVLDGFQAVCLSVCLSVKPHAISVGESVDHFERPVGARGRRKVFVSLLFVFFIPSSILCFIFLFFILSFFLLFLILFWMGITRCFYL